MNMTWTPTEERDRLTRKQIAELFLRQDGKCPNCGQKLHIKGHTEMECNGVIDEHVNPLWRGGTNKLSNRALWCKPCARDKTSEEATQRAKTLSTRDKYIGAKKSRSPMPGGKNSKYKKKMNGQVVLR